MARFIPWQTAHANRRAGESVVGGVSLMRTEFFGPSTFFHSMSRAERMALHEQLLEQPDAPHAYHIEVPALSDTPAHFHRVPQFQIFVDGSGKLGRRHDVRVATIHYTDEYTGYGPIIAGDAGLSYFTLRGCFDPGAENVDQPGVREKLRPSARRHLTIGSGRVALSDAQSLFARGAVASDCMIEPHADGLAAHVLRGGPGATLSGPDPASGGGQYWLVLNGSVTYDGGPYMRHSLGWIARSEPALNVTAGPGGAEVGVFQFPRSLSSRAAST